MKNRSVTLAVAETFDKHEQELISAIGCVENILAEKLIGKIKNEIHVPSAIEKEFFKDGSVSYKMTTTIVNPQEYKKLREDVARLKAENEMLKEELDAVSELGLLDVLKVMKQFELFTEYTTELEMLMNHYAIEMEKLG